MSDTVLDAEADDAGDAGAEREGSDDCMPPLEPTAYAPDAGEGARPSSRLVASEVVAAGMRASDGDGSDSGGSMPELEPIDAARCGIACDGATSLEHRVPDDGSESDGSMPGLEPLDSSFLGAIDRDTAGMSESQKRREPELAPPGTSRFDGGVCVVAGTSAASTSPCRQESARAESAYEFRPGLVREAERQIGPKGAPWPGPADEAARRPSPPFVSSAVAGAGAGGEQGGGPPQTDCLLNPCSDELAEGEYGYPKWPEEMKDPDFFHEELQRMRTDPRHNKNLLMKPEDQEYWNEAARAPWAKLLLRREQHWTMRRNLWLKQYEQVCLLNNSREQAAELLKECTPETKRLVAPMLKYKVVDLLLSNIIEESRHSGIPFAHLMERPETLANLQAARKRLDKGGEAEAQRILNDLGEMVDRAKQEDLEKQQLEAKERGRTLIDMKGLKTALDFGQKCKKDGLVEWERGNWEEALASWRQGDDTLKRFRAPESYVGENGMILELHAAVLRNMAQAAIKLGRWHDALDAADRALGISDQDHKAWFRKACAFEGLGELGEAAACFERVEQIALGRPDCERLAEDVRRRHERLKSLGEKSSASQRRMLEKSVRLGVFASGRDASDAAQQEPLVSSPSRPAVGQSQASEHVGAAQGLQVKRGLETGEKRPAANAAAAAAATVPSPAKSSAPAIAPSPAASTAPPASANAAAPTAKPLGAVAPARHCLTRDGARNLLADLAEAYSDPSFVQRVDKLIADVRLDTGQFMQHLPRLALDVQRPVLARWGFEASPKGVRDMQAAMREHTRGAQADLDLQRRAAEVGRLVYGTPELGMHERVQLLA